MSRTVLCGICNTLFECGSPGLCWCTFLPITKERREFISKVANDCVCPDCLKG